jgi:hypothetical protein
MFPHETNLSSLSKEAVQSSAGALSTTLSGRIIWAYYTLIKIGQIIF